MREQPSAGWGLPLAGPACGALSVPLLFLSSLSFVLSASTVVASFFLALLTLGERPTRAQLAASLGGVVLASIALALFVVPLLSQQ